MKSIYGRVMATLLGAALALAGCGDKSVKIDYSGPTDQWPFVGHNIGGDRYSPLTQVNKANVGKLKVAWVYHNGDFSKGTKAHGPSAFEVAPLVVKGSMYFCTPYDRVISLDPKSGAERWIFDPKVNLTGVYSEACRGVTYWHDSQASTDSPRACNSRIFVGTLDGRIIAVDADTGKRCAGFGDNGAIDIRKRLGEVRRAEVYMTSPPLVMDDLVIAGSFVLDGQRVNAPGGGIRAWDARTGKLVWVWDPAPPSMTPVTADQLRNGAIMTRGTPNSWALLSADPKRGLVFVGTGNPSPDHYGGKERDHKDYYGSSIVALDVHTGEVVWHFQTTHHDLWDYDVPAQPVTFVQDRNGRKIAGVIGATKSGHVFLLDRETGKPLFPVEERPVPQTDVPGEYTSPTQPFPTLPPPLHPETLTANDIWGLTFYDRGKCREAFEKLRYDGIFTPPSLKGTLAYPGLGGGINWGSVSVDPVHNRMIVNLMIAPFTIQLVPRAEAGASNGADQVGENPQEGTPYVVRRNVFLSPWGTPCVKPPWGKLIAINLNTGEIEWQRPLGTLEGLAPMGGLFKWGTPNTGGSLQTASGLTIIGATLDGYLRAFDSATGKLLWRHKLPYPAMATPITYRIGKDSRQYIVIAAGGHGALGAEPGDALVAFALPKEKP